MTKTKVKETKRLDHVEAIRRLLMTVRASARMHALIIEGPAGWGKTTSVDVALKQSGVQSVHLGSYSTPLNLFNFLSENPKSFVLIDDCAGLFSDQSSMAILKAATWTHGSKRLIRWGSTSTRAAVDEFLFEGKLVVVCNTFPNTADAMAVRSRSFPFRVEITAAHAKTLLEAAADDQKLYPNTDVANSVAKFLSSRLTINSVHQLSYRTLQMGYELAMHNPEYWKPLLEQMLVPDQEDPKKLVRKLARQDLKVKEQLRMFEESTGLKRRTFFKYRQKLNLVR